VLDLVLVGGGLANGLLAARLAQLRPELRVQLLEAGPVLGGNHTWSFHGTDVTDAQRAWLQPLITRSWTAHDVVFAGGARRLGGDYHSIASEDFHQRLVAQLGDRVRLGARASEVGPTHVVLGSGERLEAHAVIDGRGFSSAPEWPCGYQKFLGLDVELEGPHGLDAPLLMDGRVEQGGAFRFLYLLPWDARRVLVEDTMYADGPELDLPLLRARIHAYLAGRGLRVATVLREEAAALPIPLGGEAPVLERPTVGVAAGLFHATTGYSLPMAAEVADALAAREDLSAEGLTAWLQAHARRHWRRQGFFRLVNRMLFRGAEPDARVRIFDSFYRHDEQIIARFYAGRLNVMDMAAILARGSRTVPGLRAMSAALS
jgi:lycopene beta-cyclase